MRVAFATHDMKRVDAHFASAKAMAIYEVSPDAHSFVEAVQFDNVTEEDGNHDESVDRLTTKIDALEGCNLLFVLAIGGPAAARVVNRRIHPVKITAPEPIADVIGRLQTMLNGTPPPWMRKILNQGKTTNFEDED